MINLFSRFLNTPAAIHRVEAWNPYEKSKAFVLSQQHIIPFGQLLKSPDSASRFPLVFLHIPKAAGSSFRHVIAANYPEDRVYSINSAAVRAGINRDIFKRRTPDGIPQYRVIMGHLTPRSNVYEFIPAPFIHLTMLRDPVKRVISHYNYIINTPSHNRHAAFIDADLKLDNFLETMRVPEMNNGMTRRLAARKKSPDFGECPEELLEEAKHNLEKCYSCFGITEMFAESLQLLHVVLQWQNIDVKFINVAEKKTQQNEISEIVTDNIRKYNKLDVKLYEYASELFHKRLRCACK